MSILQIITDEPGQINTPNVRRVKIVSSDNLATVTTAGYLNPSVLQGFTIYNTDIIDMWYGATGNVNGITNPGTYAEFLPTIANGIITLALQVSPGDVLLPVTSGHLAAFNGTTGQIKDSGLAPSAASQSFVSTNPGSLTVGQLAEYKDANGTLQNSGLLATNAMSKAAVNTMAAGGEIILDKGTATTTGGAATVNKQSGVLTTESLTTAGGAAYVITLTNSEVTAASVVLLTWMGGTNTTLDFNMSAVPTTNTITITINNLTASTNFDGTIILGFAVF